MPLVLERIWLGRRVVVRRAWRGGASDLIGELRTLDDQRAVVRTRDGRDVEIELASIRAARLVEASTRDIIDLERVAARGWPSIETVAAHGWLLRADHGFSARANSVLALHSPDPNLASALATSRAWYADRRLPLLIALPLPARRALDQALARAGWTIANDISMMISRTADQISTSVPGVEIATAPDPAWLAGYHHPAPSAEVVRALLTRPELVAFASVRRDGRVVAIARGVVDEGWLGLSAIEVAPAHRRQGLAGALIGSLSAWATSLGATRTYLQVERANAGAIALYRRLGFWEHHTYVYRSDPEPVGSSEPYDG